MFYNLIGLILSCYVSYTALVFSDNKSINLFIRFVTPSPLSLSLSLKTSCISKLLIRGVVFPDLIWWSFFLIMFFIRSSAFNYHNRLVIIILSLSEVMLLYSYCEEKKLVCVIITVFTGCQPSSCVKCTQVNMQLSCNI